MGSYNTVMMSYNTLDYCNSHNQVTSIFQANVSVLGICIKQHIDSLDHTSEFQIFFILEKRKNTKFKSSIKTNPYICIFKQFQAICIVFKDFQLPLKMEFKEISLQTMFRKRTSIFHKTNKYKRYMTIYDHLKNFKTSPIERIKFCYSVSFS